jgi:peptide/nickel transport system permease protein
VLVTLIILGCSLLGGALEDALNPRLRVAHLSARTFRLRPLVGRGEDAL